MRSLHTSSQYRMALCRVTADDNDEPRVFDVLDRAGIAAIANGSEQTLCRGSLTVAGAVVHVVGSDNGARQLLHQIALFIGAFGRRDKRQRVRPGPGLDLREFSRHQVEGLVPGGLAKYAIFTNQRLGQPVRAVYIVPGKFSFHARRDSVRRAFQRFHLENLAVLCPDVEATPDSAIGTDGLRAADA